MDTSKVKIEDKYYYDGAISDPYPLRKALEDGCEKVIVISNFSPGSNQGPITKLSPLAIKAGKKYTESIGFIEVKSQESPREIFLLRPSHQIMSGGVGGTLDTNRDRINEGVDMGIQDAERFLVSFKAH